MMGRMHLGNFMNDVNEVLRRCSYSEITTLGVLCEGEGIHTLSMLSGQLLH
jgi:hypothetical protein